MSQKIEIGDIVTITFKVKEIHEGYKTLKINDALWVSMDKVNKLSKSEAMLWKLENEA